MDILIKSFETSHPVVQVFACYVGFVMSLVLLYVFWMIYDTFWG